MSKARRKKYLCGTVIIACIIMGFVDAVIQPEYAIKSIIKIITFLCFPIIYSLNDKQINLKSLWMSKKDGALLAIGLGIGIYALIVGGYLLIENILDFSAITKTLENTVGVDAENFIWVALYISFINSLLEEFFFRGFAFLSLRRMSSRKFAYCFSSFMFAVYHIAMMVGWFGIELIVIALVGLFIGGLIFCFFNEKTGNIYISWLIHMFANFAINTVGFILFGIV